MTVLPPFARAREERRLSVETAAYAGAVAAAALPLALVGILAAEPLAAVLTGFGPEERARRGRRDAALADGRGPWASSRRGCSRARSPRWTTTSPPAIGYIGGSLVGLALILARIDENGVEAVAWGMALNAAIATLVSTLVLARRARAERMPRQAIRPRRGGMRRRMLRAPRDGVALPFALQAIYVICLPLASRGGVGDRDELRLRVPLARPRSSRSTASSASGSSRPCR